jgi:glycosyltransferase involved in cell wall biosynthesis
MVMPEKPRGLVVLLKPGIGFMEDDLAILQKAFDVRVIYRTQHSQIRYLIWAVVRQMVMHRPKFIYCWFVFPWDTPVIVGLARLFGIRSVIHVGGFDVATVPEIGYGRLLHTTRERGLVRFALNWATRVHASSNHLKQEALGIASSAKIRVVYPAIDTNMYCFSRHSKENLVITAATVGERFYKRKGLETFARCSQFLPETRFVVIGPVADMETLEYLQELGGENLRFTEMKVSKEELVTWYQKAKVYVQASAHEGFGVAMAEAMACQCVPVATQRGALPEVVGDTGFYTAYGNVEETVEAISQALVSDKGVYARQRVVENFTLAQREKKLLSVFNQLLI